MSSDLDAQIPAVSSPEAAVFSYEEGRSLLFSVNPMFILITTKNCNLKHEPLPEQVCPLCGFKGGVTLDIWKQVVGAFYVPMMPALRPKSAELGCASCGSRIPKDRWSQELKSFIQRERDSVRLPNRYRFGMLYFLGAMALIFAVALGYGLATRGPRLRREQELAANMAHPQVGQILAYTITKAVSPRSVGMAGFGFGKIERIEGDTLWVRTYGQPLSTSQVSEWMDKKYDLSRMTGPVMGFKLGILTHGGRMVPADGPEPKLGEPPAEAWGMATSICSAQ